MPELHKSAKDLQNHKFKGSEDSEEYSGTEFGGFGEYFHNKLLKLQNQAQQNYEIESQIFKDCVVYITGYTKPSAPEIKRLVTSNGGTMCHYLAGKTYATHIVASSLTSRKRIEYAKYKIVRPEWIKDCVEQGKLLPWHNYRVTSENVNVQKIPDALDPKFVENYYKNSRLHHLSSWKADLKRRFQSMAKKCNKGQKPVKNNHTGRLIIHVDFDSFFAAVSLLNYPHLQSRPVCVSNSNSDGGNGDVASCNYKAREFGVKNGMWVSHAKKFCPDLQTIPYDFDGYEKSSNALYDILVKLNPDVLFPVSVDEALIDVTSLIGSNNSDGYSDNVLKFCSDLRTEIKIATGVNVSIGAGPNVLLAKVALRRAKPDGEYYISFENISEFLDSLPVRDLPGVGPHISQKLAESEWKIETVGGINQAGKSAMIDLLGSKLGTRLYEASQGIDDTDITDIPGPQSVGVEIAWGIRLKTQDHVMTFTRNLCREMIKRMRLESDGLMGCQLIAKVYQRHPDAPIEPPKYLGHGHCNITTKSSSKFPPTNDERALSRVACDLVSAFSCPPEDFRGLGLQITKLETGYTTENGNNSAAHSPIKKREMSTSATPSPIKAGNAPKYMTITQQFRNYGEEGSASPSPSPSKKRKKIMIEGTMDLPSQIHPEVFDELPPDIQKEINRVRGHDETDKSTLQSNEELPTIINKKYTPVTFIGNVTDESEIRKLISQWMSSTEFPHYDDVVLIENYLTGVIKHDKNWGKALQLVQYMEHCAKNTKGTEWWPLVEILRDDIVKSQLKSIRGLNV